MSVIEASSVTVKTMADNTLRLTVDIEPRFAKQAFALFGERGTSMALAALKPGAQPEPEPEKPKGGFISKWLALRCAEDEFQHFLVANNPFGWQIVTCGTHAADLVRKWCGVGSRAEIDHDPRAKKVFDEQIRLPYMKWCATHGFTAPEYAEA